VATDRRTRRMCLGIALLLGATVVGCAAPIQATRLARSKVLLGAIAEPATTQPAGAIQGYDDGPWQALLLKHVAPGWPPALAGQPREASEPPCPCLVEYRQILEHPADLNAYLTVLAATGPAKTPAAFPSDAHRMAYYLNAYNACAIRAALADYPTESVYTTLKPTFEHDWYFSVDGQRLNLLDLRHKLGEVAHGDVRFLFALCPAAIGAPPLAPHPYKAEDVYDELDAQVKLCLSMPQFVAVVHDRQNLQVWSQILRNEEAFSAWYEHLYGSRPASLLNVIMELAPPRQRESFSKAVGYKIVEVPFDRRLNDLAERFAE
jgi:hypothetical protein